MSKERRFECGQAILSEYVMIFFVVIAAIVAMTVFVQRSLNARIHDARDFAISAVNGVCDANCQEAAGNVTYEYEPYYTQLTAQSQQNQEQTFWATNGSANIIGAVYGKIVNEATQANAVSGQLPPECAGASPPSWCANL